MTLITGDQVLLSGPNLEGVSVRRGAGREALRVATHRVTPSGATKPHLFVVPEDAARLIAAGKVDRRLFDVTLLLEFAYDDGHRDDLPFIVTYEKTGAAIAAVPQALPGAVVERPLPSVNGVSLVSPKARVQEVWGAIVTASGTAGATQRLAGGAPISKVMLDGLLQPVLDRSVGQIGAPAAWALGYEGDGVIVGVLDTGVDDTHPDLIDAVIVQRNFTSVAEEDTVGHGTHVASIIAGSGAAEGGRYRGVAPGVQLLSGKVCEDFGCPESSIIAGMQWAVAEEGARIVNMSLGGGDAPGYDPLEEAVGTLTAQYGALFVIAAGNSGPSAGSVQSPGAIAAALTVGAVDRDDRVAGFSSRGLTLDGALKPDLTAPGVDIVAARAAGTELGELVGDDYVMASGTSMATPHVAGAAALLLQQNPLWGPAELESALIGSAVYNDADTVRDQGGGRIDVAAALEARVLASAPNLGFGVAPWPHDDDEPTVRTLTYRNLGEATELAIELDVRGPDGAPAPEEAFRVEPASLVLPAGGTASVRVTANTRAGSADGVFGGRLLATDADGRRMAVPIAVEREVESYNLALRHIDRDGQPAQSYLALVLGFAPFFFAYVDGSGGQTLRLPRGRYIVDTSIYDPAGEDASTLLIAPNHQLVADTVLELDARTATPVVATLPVSSAQPDSATLSYDIVAPEGGLSSTIVMNLDNPVYYGGIIGAPDPDMISSLQTTWTDASTSPQSLYTAAWGGEGGLPEGDFTVPLDQLGVVNASYLPSLGGSLEHDIFIASFRFGGSGFGTSTSVFDLPLDRTEYYFSGDPALGWIGGMWAHDEAFSVNYFLDGAPSEYLPGRTYTARWNAPVFAAMLPENPRYSEVAVRSGDELAIVPRRYGDSDRHEGSLPSEGRSRLYRNGELFAEDAQNSAGRFEVPPEPASYRFEFETSQSLFELTTEQRVAWSFESAHIPDGESARLPLLTFRFAPALDVSGRAPRGGFCLPFEIAEYAGGSVADIAPPSIEVSYDDGLTWAAASVRPNGSRYDALLEHPAGARYVSLRASAQGPRGNAVEQTLIRAYALLD